MAYKIGIDAGSKTIKLVVLDEDNRLVFSTYHRHRYNIKKMLRDSLHELNWRFGVIEGSICVTGSAGIGVAQACELPFEQELIATTCAVQEKFPSADVVIELGGEDAKIVYLTGGLEQRMNASCAGGTGGFIDNMAYILGTRTAEMGRVSLGARQVYPIASRCAVFAQTDIRPLMNAGASLADLAASTLDAVVRQTIGGLACGRPIEGTVVYLGGPFQYVPQLAMRFTHMLNLERGKGILPENAHLYTATGAALLGAKQNDPCFINTGELEQRVQDAHFEDDTLNRLQPLFEDAAEIEPFVKAHDVGFPRKRLFDTQGKVYLGIDAGSTTVKIALLDEDANLVYSDYQENEGDVLGTTVTMLRKMYRDFPHSYQHENYVQLAYTTVTGYGEDMLCSGLGADYGVVETTAHIQAALHFDPELSFMLDIGGQDMKAVWVRNGMVENTVLNEACSSGCGAFLSGTAWGLHTTIDSFSRMAMESQAPIDLGTKCTVFMNSRLKHAQKSGAQPQDLAAGCVYSVVKNALFRIVGINNLDTLGDHIVVQGGTFKNNAVLRAFELISGKKATRPNQAHLMGAIGAALISKQRAEQQQGAPVHSGLLSYEELKNFSVKRNSAYCSGCSNNCLVSLLDFGNGRSFINGNKCNRAYDALAHLLPQGNREQAHSHAPNVYALERALIQRFVTVETEGALGKMRVGLIPAFSLYEHTPFWHTLLVNCGFSVVMPNAATNAVAQGEAAASIPSESVCMAAKISHTYLVSVEKQGATALFMPQFERGAHCAVSSLYPNALKDGARKSSHLAKSMVSPKLFVSKPSLFKQDALSLDELYASLCELAARAQLSLPRAVFDAALDAALCAQEKFQKEIVRANEQALAWVNDPTAPQPRHGIVLTGRPYHVDNNLSHGIDEVLCNLNLAVLSPLGVPKQQYSLAEMFAAPRHYKHWVPSSHYMRIAEYVRRTPALEAVYLYSFGCTYDNISLDDARNYLHKAGKTFTALKIDEIVDSAHIRIRLRTLAESLEQASMRPHNAGGVAEGGLIDGHVLNEQTIVPESPVQARVVGTLSESVVAAARKGELSAFAHFDEYDVETARLYVHDICYTTSVMFGRALRIVIAAPDLQTLRIPYVCHECVFDALPVMLARTTGRFIEVDWCHDWQPEEAQTPAASASEPAASAPEPAASAPESAASASEPANNNTPRPRIGIVGTLPLCYDSFINDHLVQIIQAHDCEAVIAPVEDLRVDDVRYVPALQRFVDEGIKQVIYLQSFGCLKVHVQGRGALHELKERFPQLTITVIDYDAETSALNRENRVRLAIAAAKQLVNNS